MQTVFRNARIVLADAVIDGAIAIEGETIAAIDRGSRRRARIWMATT